MSGFGHTPESSGLAPPGHSPGAAEANNNNDEPAVAAGEKRTGVFVAARSKPAAAVSADEALVNLMVDEGMRIVR